jgi:hypothetical protein
LGLSVAAAALVGVLGGVPPALAQTATTQSAASGVPAFAPGMINHMQQMRRFPDPDRGAQDTPRVIPRFDSAPDPAGAIATFQPNGATFTNQNAFFTDMGTNGRTCLTCHMPQNGWGISAADVADRFDKSAGRDPIFRLVDGATCPSANVATLNARKRAYKLLTDFGLIRIGLAMPAVPGLEFSVQSVQDPYRCNTDPDTGLTSPTTGVVSVYRRPLPSTNLGFLSAIMWDGREPSLESQAVDATLGHAQADAAPTPAQVQQIVNFETGVFTAQVFDNKAHDLTDRGAKGGPTALSLQPFFIGINDPLGQNPTGAPFTSQIFDIYRPWLGVRGFDDEARRRQSVARGEEVFNDTNINITGVAGLNDVLNTPSIPGFCGTCHDSPNVGDHSVKAPLNIGIADPEPAALDASMLPVFTLKCNAGPLAGQTFHTTDPGRALISGKCADIGKFKGPILRGLASRAPFFHNGAAGTLTDVVNFYNQRFSIGLTPQQKTDLVNFLNTL